MRVAEPDFRAMFDRSPVGMAVLNGAGIVLQANRALAQFLGKAPSDLMGTALHDLAAVDDVGRFRPGVGERRLRHERGHDGWVVVSAVELPESGQGALLVCGDPVSGLIGSGPADTTETGEGTQRCGPAPVG